MKPPTLEEIRAKKYGWGLHEYAYNHNFCAADVLRYKWRQSQCSRKPGHGPHGAFCKQHAKRYSEDDN